MREGASVVYSLSENILQPARMLQYPWDAIQSQPELTFFGARRCAPVNTMMPECPDGASGHLHADDVPTLVAFPTAPVTSVAAGGGGEGGGGVGGSGGSGGGGSGGGGSGGGGSGGGDGNLELSDPPPDSQGDALGERGGATYHLKISKIDVQNPPKGTFMSAALRWTTKPGVGWRSGGAGGRAFYFILPA